MAGEKAGEDRVLAGGAKHIDFQTDPSRYRHWKLDVAGDVATLTMDVDENGGLSRVVDKRKVRRDHADFFCTIEEGIKGKRAVAWRLVDEIVPNSKLEARVTECAREFAAASKRNGNGKGISLKPLTRKFDDNGIRYGLVSVDIDRSQRIATISIHAPDASPPADI